MAQSSSIDPRRARATSFDAHMQRLVRLQFPARRRAAWRSALFSMLWAKTLHGGALDYGSSKQPTTTLAVLARHPLRVYKHSGFDSLLRPQLSLWVASITVMHLALNQVIRVRFPGDPPRTDQPIGERRSDPTRRESCGVGAPQSARCGLTVRHGVWDAGIGGSIPLTST